MSNPTEKVNYQGNPIVSVRIVSIHPSRLVVSLPDRRRGYIYKNDWSWDRSIRSAPKEFPIGEKIDAVLMQNTPGRNTQRLSIRHLQNPWTENTTYTVGTSLLAEVIYLRSHSVFIQLEPGITAVAYSKDIPLLEKQLPLDVLAVGDKVWVTVTELLPQKKRISVSLLLPLQQAQREWNLDLKALFFPQLEALAKELHKSSFPNKKSKQFYLTKPLKGFSSVLMVEDNPSHAHTVEELLRKEFSSQVATVTSSTTALEELAKGQDYDFLLTDINLSNDSNGLALATKVLQQYPEQPVVLMSSNALAEWDVKKVEELFKLRLLFVEKPLDESSTIAFLECLKLLREGKIRMEEGVGNRRDERFLNNMEQQIDTHTSLKEEVDYILKNLCLESLLDHAFLLKLDSQSKTVEIIGSHLKDIAEPSRTQVDNLYYSPVRNIAEDEEVLYVSQRGESVHPVDRHNFFQHIRFYSCYGMPLKVALSGQKYALVVLDSATDISGSSILRIRTANAYLSKALEHDAMLSILRKQQDLASQGILMGSLMHELYNKLEPLFGFLDLGQQLQKEGKKEDFWKYIADVGPELLRIKELTQAYTRLAKFELQRVNLNDVVEKVRQQLLPLAQDKGINLSVNMGTKDSFVWGMSMHLEQILTNVVLNAIQWVEEQNWQWQKINQRHGLVAETALQNRRNIQIGVCKNSEKDTCCILVTDEGPGILYSLKDKIFAAHVSQREKGQGLGLFISRNLATAMQGKLEYVDSIRFMGSLFALLFPVSTENFSENE